MIKIRAFTLFEVLVALAILSITMVAAIVTTDNVLDRTVYLEKKALAHFVGMNVLNDQQLNLTRVVDLNNKITGKMQLRGQEFTWAMKMSKIDFAGVQLLDMQVSVSDSSSDRNIIDNVSRAMPIKN